MNPDMAGPPIPGGPVGVMFNTLLRLDFTGKPPQALALARKLARYGACMMILIHPDVLDHKLEFERGFVMAMKDFAWFGALGEFGSWWAARDRVEVDLSDDGRTIQLEVPHQIQGLTLELPTGWQFSASIPANLKIT